MEWMLVRLRQCLNAGVFTTTAFSQGMGPLAMYVVLPLPVGVVRKVSMMSVAVSRLGVEQFNHKGVLALFRGIHLVNLSGSLTST